MSSLTVTKIERETAHEQLTEFLSSRPHMPLYMYSPHMLITFLTHQEKSLYIAELNSEKILIDHKEKFNDIRFLFEHPSDGMIAAITEHFNPDYMAVNECVTPSPDKQNSVISEYSILLEPLAGLNDKSIRKKYNQAVRKNTSVTYEKYSPKHLEGIKAFIEKWNTTRSEEYNAYAATYNDLYFLELYGNDPDLIGGVALDNGEVVGYTLCVPFLNGKLIAAFNKILRGYTELGLFLYVERAKQLLALGHQTVHIGSINNEFKTHFLDGSEKIESYAYMIFKKFEPINNERYVQMIF